MRPTWPNPGSAWTPARPSGWINEADEYRGHAAQRTIGETGANPYLPLTNAGYFEPLDKFMERGDKEAS
jgi:hypothetical protein